MRARPPATPARAPARRADAAATVEVPAISRPRRGLDRRPGPRSCPSGHLAADRPRVRARARSIDLSIRTCATRRAAACAPPFTDARRRSSPSPPATARPARDAPRRRRRAQPRGSRRRRLRPARRPTIGSRLPSPRHATSARPASRGRQRRPRRAQPCVARPPARSSWPGRGRRPPRPAKASAGQRQVRSARWRRPSLVAMIPRMLASATTVSLATDGCSAARPADRERSWTCPSDPIVVGRPRPPRSRGAAR
ncbi:hypothetical protein SAMN02745121_05022 [Nannocystis exedens]|uniref:Uncharacterized protein n=1 Tax=Nannocystis exedens TaxID=54 RepID=A0A1I2CB76_9BACT|nr:hypothetical protein NAEX_01422 [Nannocystis exedens]SFE65468.1 hypothetical protein SAMN02745121_05022 [Nannocystis exedens]